jgi:flavin reductase (DIM6/NTAB) family NADH-FMN oxidoreductase RutF
MTKRHCSPDEFRAAMSRWCSGVSVVTVRDGDECHGVTVSAFASVDLDPPTILICLRTNGRTAQIIAKRGVFAVSILSAGQCAISDRFATRGREQEQFVGTDFRDGQCGVPLIENALANLECEVTNRIFQGDTTVFFASVTTIRTTEVDPLLYFRGGYQEIVYGRRKAPR